MSNENLHLVAHEGAFYLFHLLYWHELDLEIIPRPMANGIEALDLPWRFKKVCQFVTGMNFWAIIGSVNVVPSHRMTLAASVPSLKFRCLEEAMAAYFQA